MLNVYLKEQMDGLTAKVFRTYNASITLQNQLDLMTKETLESKVNEKMLFYNQCNKMVAILCNHQRSVSKTFGEQIEKIEEKVFVMLFH
jgi:DNA topoisomerase-1